MIENGERLWVYQADKWTAHPLRRSNLSCVKARVHLPPDNNRVEGHRWFRRAPLFVCLCKHLMVSLINRPQLAGAHVTAGTVDAFKRNMRRWEARRGSIRADLFCKITDIWDLIQNSMKTSFLLVGLRPSLSPVWNVGWCSLQLINYDL